MESFAKILKEFRAFEFLKEITLNIFWIQGDISKKINPWRDFLWNYVGITVAMYEWFKKIYIIYK